MCLEARHLSAIECPHCICIHHIPSAQVADASHEAGDTRQCTTSVLGISFSIPKLVSTCDSCWKADLRMQESKQLHAIHQVANYLFSHTAFCP